MRAVARLVLVLAVLPLVSCAAPDATEQATAPEPTPVAPSASADPCLIGAPVAGDAVLASALVTDAHGQYCSVALAPGAEAMQLDLGVIEQGELETWGFSEADALAVEVVEVSAQGGKSVPRSITVQIEATSVFRPADGTAGIPVVTDYGLALDPEGGIVGVSYSYSLEG